MYMYIYICNILHVFSCPNRWELLALSSEEWAIKHFLNVPFRKWIIHSSYGRQ